MVREKTFPAARLHGSTKSSHAAVAHHHCAGLAKPQSSQQAGNHHRNRKHRGVKKVLGQQHGAHRCRGKKVELNSRSLGAQVV
jgi:hypothetical protein